MTLTSTTTRLQFNGDSSTILFTISFIFFDDSDIKAILTDVNGIETVWVLGTQYTLTGGSGLAGTLTVEISPTDYTPLTGETLTIKSNLPNTQTTSLPLGGPLPSTAVEQRFDKSVRLIQQRNEELDRTAQLVESSTLSGITLPGPGAGQYLRWNVGGTDLETDAGSINNSNFLQSGTGAVTRSVTSKIGEIVSVKDFGATGNGVTDDAAAIQAAHDSLGANGGELFFPDGTYIVSTVINITKSINIRGTGKVSTTIRTSSGTAQIFNVSVQSIFINNMRFNSSVTRTAGAFIQFTTNGGRGSVKDFLMEDYYIGIQITASATVRIKDGTLSNGATSAGSTGILLDGGNDHYIDNITMDAPVGSQPAAGITVTQTGALNITNCDIIHHSNCLVIAPGNGESVSSVYVINSFFDNGVNGILITPTGTGIVTRCHFISCWTSSQTGRGVFINNTGSGACSGIEFIGHTAVLNAIGGLQVELGAEDVNILGGFFAQNTGSGITFGNTIDDFKIIGVSSGAVAGGTGNTAFGILVFGTTHDRYTISHNHLGGNTSGGLDDQGTSGTEKVIRNNIGHVTEASGTGSVLSTATTDIITHGLDETPSAKDINITFTEQGDNDYGRWWVDTITATVFTLNVTADPGASNLDFEWQAIIL